MANHTHKSGGGNGMKVDIDITDYTEEITAGIKAAIKRALIRIGLDAETYAKKGGACGYRQTAEQYHPFRQGKFCFHRQQRGICPV